MKTQTLKYIKCFLSPPNLANVRIITTETWADSEAIADRIAQLSAHDAGNPVRNVHGNDFFYYGITTQGDSHA